MKRGLGRERIRNRRATRWFRPCGRQNEALDFALAMRVTRRWLAASIVALGLLPGVERVVLAHAHHGAGPAAELAAPVDADAPGGLSGCAACQARATLDSLVVDAHPERHGAAPALALSHLPCAAPGAPRLQTPPARGPPLRIV